VFYVPNPRLDDKHRQILVCGRTRDYNAFPAEFTEPVSGDAAMLFRQRNRSSFPFSVARSFVDHPRPASPEKNAHRYFRDAFDILVVADPVEPKVMTVGWYAERDAIQKIVNTDGRKCKSVSECDLLRALQTVRKTCWQPQNCGVIKYLASTLASHDTRLCVYTDWYALGDMFQSRFRFSAAECAGIFTGALQGIRFINRTMEYLHNDIKPENVFVGIREGRCVGVIGDIARGVPVRVSVCV
jgi:serine/threonine protein kinase